MFLETGLQVLTLIMILNCKNKLVWLIISSIFSFFSLHVFEILDLEVLDFWIFTELSILEWFSTLRFKHAIISVLTYFKVRIPVNSYFHIPIVILEISFPFSKVHPFF